MKFVAKIKRKGVFCLMGTVLLFSGCSFGGQSRPSDFYVLTALPEDTTPIVDSSAQLPAIEVGQVQIPDFLDRPQIVTKVAKNQIVLSEFNRWGESFQAGITRVIRTNLAVLLGGGKVGVFPCLQPFSKDYVIHLVLLEFEVATYRNEVLLRGMYRITDSKEPQRFIAEEIQFTRPIKVGRSSSAYPMIADAMSQTLEDLCRAVAEKVANLAPPAEQDDV